MNSHEYATIASLARSRAREAMHQGNPVRAREWIEAARAADAAAGSADEAALIRIADALERIAAYVEPQGG